MNLPGNIKAIDIGVVGAGSWGTALANLLCNKGYAVDLWVYEKEVKKQIEQTQTRLKTGDFALPGPVLRNA